MSQCVSWITAPDPDPDPTLPTAAVRRIPYILCITIVAAAFPFFSEIMGFIGAVGLTPLCFVIPVYLYLVAHERSALSRASYWFHVALMLIFTVVGLLATIGSVRSIVLAIQDHLFFS